MADMKIDEATRVSSVGGSEVLPASSGGAAASLTTSQIKDYVFSAIKAITGVQNPGVADEIVVKVDNDLKKVRVDTLADKIAEYAFGKTAASSLNGVEIVSIEQSDVAKTTTLYDIAEYVKTRISQTIDIDGCTQASGLDDSDIFAVGQKPSGSTAYTTKKSMLSSICSYIRGKIFKNASSKASLASNDYILVAGSTDANEEPKKVLVSDCGFGSGNVSGPTVGSGSSVDGNIPQYDGANGRTLKSGYGVDTSITSTSSGIPTSAAVLGAIGTQLSGAGDVKGPALSTDGNIPLYDGTSGKILKDGLTKVTSIPVSPTDSQVPTAKAVNIALSNKATLPQTITANKIPQWGSGGSLTDGLSVVTSIGNEPSDSKIPTEQAVSEALDGKVSIPAQTTDGNIPQWGSGGILTNNLSVVTSIGESPANTNIPTEKAVSDAIGEIEEAQGDVKGPNGAASIYEGKIPIWGNTPKTLLYGKTVRTQAPFGSITATDDELPTAKLMYTELSKRPELDPEHATNGCLLCYNSNYNTIGTSGCTTPESYDDPLSTENNVVATGKQVRDYVATQLVSLTVVTTLPDASESVYRKVYLHLIGDGGSASATAQLCVCLKDSTNIYYWVKCELSRS